MTGQHGRVRNDLEARARAWLDDDPDPSTRAELEGLLALAEEADLEERFSGRLSFGTAGIRGELGAGPMRMNIALARRVAAGLAGWLLDAGATGGVVVGYDARSRSADIAADVAAVVAGAGIPCSLLPDVVPTPILAFAVRHLGAAAGVMVTASHNPPADNGIKVYGADGAQIVPPTDAEISARIDAVRSVRDLPLGTPTALGNEVLEAYVAAAAATVPDGPRDVTLVHTALHGVGTAPLLALFERAGFPSPVLVDEQADPDGRFPTVSFPNPEEPGALDLALSLARKVGADAVLANDPDADRLAVAVRDELVWRALTGDELGALLGDHLLRTTSGDDRLVATTVVSSPLLVKLAAEHGVECTITLTGFKWIMRAATDRPGKRFVFGYEEALGYAVTDLVRDKDGLTAALAAAALIAQLKADGSSLLERLEEIYERHGLHATRQWSVRMPGADGAVRIAAAVDRLVSAPPATLAGRTVLHVDQPAPDVVVLWLEDGGRVVVRPSGTEPKLKVYLLTVVPAGAHEAAREALEELRLGVADLLGLADSA
jgi:phosphomannomutase